MWFDVVAIGVLLGFAIAGAWKGALATGLRLASLLGAYVVAALGAAPCGPAVAAWFGIAPVLGVAAAGVLLFLCGYAVFALVTFGIVRLERHSRGELPRETGDRVGGAVFGLLRGGLVVLLLGVLSLQLDGLRATGNVSGVPTTGPSAVKGATQAVVAGGSELVLGDDDASARMATRMLADPAQTVDDFQAVLDNPRVRELRDDALFWSYLANNNPDAALNRGSFIGIAHDETLRAQIGELGLVKREAAADPRAFKTAVADVIREIAPRVQGLMQDPEVHELLRDPEIQRALQDGDTVTLLRHPGFQRIVAKVTNGGASGE
jgi:uncharacterized membrane protein required for colicin V production